MAKSAKLGAKQQFAGEQDGESCEDLTRTLERRLGKQEGERTLKAEYYEEEDILETDREIEGA